MKKLTTAVLAALMLTGILTAATSTPSVKPGTMSVTASDGGPVPLCDPYSNPNCRIK